MRNSNAVLIPLGLLILVAVAAGLLLSGAPAGPSAPGPARPDEGAPAAAGTTARRLPEPPDGSGGAAAGGFVVDLEGEPVPGARVRLLGPPPAAKPPPLPEKEADRLLFISDLFQYYPDERSGLHPLSAGRPPPPGPATLGETVTGPDGSFRFERIPLPEARIRAEKGTRASAPVRIRPGASVRLVLRDGARLRGWVAAEEDGRTLAGAVVRVSAGAQVFTATTGENGSYSFTGLPAGPAAVEAWHPDYPGAVKTPVRLARGEERELPLTLSRGASLTVVVREYVEDRPEGPPLPGVIVALLRKEDEGYATAVTGEDGRAVFEGLPPGSYGVNASKGGYLPPGEEQVRVPPAGGEPHVLEMERAVVRTVRVLDGNGRPVAGAEMFTGNLDEEFQAGESKRVGVTDRDGTFRYAFDWDGKHSSLVVRKAGYAMTIVIPDDPSEEGEIVVRLPPGRLLRGKVTDASGRPLAGAEVVIDVLTEDDAEDLTATIYTDEKGEYRFPWLPEGDATVEVSAEGFIEDDRDFEVGARSEYIHDFRLERDEE